MGLSSEIFLVGSDRRACFETQCVMTLQGHPRSLMPLWQPAISLLYSVLYCVYFILAINSVCVCDFGTNRKRVCDFVLVINSGLCPILPRFKDIAGLLRRAIPPLVHLNFRRVPLGLATTSPDVVPPRSEYPKLIIRVINFELVQPT